MENKEIFDMINNLNLKENIKVEDIPNIDLYMDQVIQLFENKFNKGVRNDKEKVLTKTMINNYAKGKLFMPIKNKKYSKDHLMLISIIYQLKGSLSINDIKTVLNPIVENYEEENCDIEKIYKKYLKLYEDNVENFQDSINKSIEKVEQDEIKDSYYKKIIVLMQFVTMSNFYRRLAEKLVDTIE